MCNQFSTTRWSLLVVICIGCATGDASSPSEPVPDGVRTDARSPGVLDRLDSNFLLAAVVMGLAFVAASSADDFSRVPFRAWLCAAIASPVLLVAIHVAWQAMGWWGKNLVSLMGLLLWAVLMLPASGFLEWQWDRAVERHRNRSHEDGS
jgi:uncharacterized membrane protein